MAVVVAATAAATAEQTAGGDRVLRSMGAKMDPLTGVSATATEATLCSVLAGVDTIELQQLTTAFVRAVHGERAADPAGQRPG